MRARRARHCAAKVTHPTRTLSPCLLQFGTGTAPARGRPWRPTTMRLCARGSCGYATDAAPRERAAGAGARVIGTNAADAERRLSSASDSAVSSVPELQIRFCGAAAPLGGLAAHSRILNGRPKAPPSACPQLRAVVVGAVPPPPPPRVASRARDTSGTSWRGSRRTSRSPTSTGATARWLGSGGSRTGIWSRAGTACRPSCARCLSPNRHPALPRPDPTARRHAHPFYDQTHTSPSSRWRARRRQVWWRLRSRS